MEKGQDKTMIQKRSIHENVALRQLPDGEMIPGTIPGSVYYDLLNAGKMEDPFWKDNELQAYELLKNDFEYTSRFIVGEEFLQADDLLLTFYGIDTIADVFLNGTLLGHTENMHRTYEFAVKGKICIGENVLRVHLYSPIKAALDSYDADPIAGNDDTVPGFARIRKAHCMYGWDWGPRLPDAGIWREVVLTAVDRARIDDVYILQHHEGDCVKLEFRTAVKEVAAGEYRMMKTVLAPDGSVAAQTEGEEAKIVSPQLWWPNGLGEQPLYTVIVELMAGEEVLDRVEKRIGLRTLTMKVEKDEWGKSFETCVNGVSFFAMGANYIPEDNLLPRMNKARSRKLLQDCVDANFNVIRVWGGAFFPADWFYDLCDEMGLVIWQDFMYCCAVYDLTEDFEDNITQELIDNVKRIRHHASLGLWCGNNEMEQFVKQGEWVTKPSEVADYIKMYEYIFPKLLKKYDPQTFYWPASPSSGGSFDDPCDPNRGDVHYWTVWHGGIPFTGYREHYFRYLSEFGFQSFPARKTIESFTSEERERNVFSYVMERHQRSSAGNSKIINYMAQTYLYPTSLDALIYASQLLQADAIRYGVEHFRRNRGRCMGAVYWQLNDIWPVASWASVDYFGRWKALHYAAKRFFAPVLLSCEEEGVLTQGTNLNQFRREEIRRSVRFNVSNETMQERKVEVVWSLRNAASDVLEEHRGTVSVPAMSAAWMEKEELPQANLYHDYVRFDMYENGEWISGGSVLFSVPKHFAFEDPHLTVETDGEWITVRSDAYAKYVEISNENEDLVLSDNYFDMDKGERKVKILRGETKNLKVRSVYDIH